MIDVGGIWGRKNIAMLDLLELRLKHEKTLSPCSLCRIADRAADHCCGQPWGGRGETRRR